MSQLKELENSSLGFLEGTSWVHFLFYLGHEFLSFPFWITVTDKVDPLAKEELELGKAPANLSSHNGESL